MDESCGIRGQLADLRHIDPRVSAAANDSDRQPWIERDIKHSRIIIHGETEKVRGSCPRALRDYHGDARQPHKTRFEGVAIAPTIRHPSLAKKLAHGCLDDHSIFVFCITLRCQEPPEPSRNIIGRRWREPNAILAGERDDALQQSQVIGSQWFKPNETNGPTTDLIDDV
jgi:hypothetical protein